MNIREQIEKEITDKVMTKLASERVELGLIDALEQFEYELSASSKSIKELLSKVEKEKSRIEKVLVTAKKRQADAEKKIKELGLSPKDLPVNSKLSKTINDTENILKTIK